jgi:hypothetical protein
MPIELMRIYIQYNILDTGGIRDTRPESQQVYCDCTYSYIHYTICTYSIFALAQKLPNVVEFLQNLILLYETRI